MSTNELLNEYLNQCGNMFISPNNHSDHDQYYDDEGGRYVHVDRD